MAVQPIRDLSDLGLRLALRDAVSRMKGAADPSVSPGMTKFKGLPYLGVGYVGWRVLRVVAADRELQVPRLRSG